MSNAYPTQINPTKVFDPSQLAEVLGQGDTPRAFNGTVSIGWLWNAKIGMGDREISGENIPAKNALLDTQNRTYQREKVATYSWQCDIMKTIFENGFKRIPEIHIRVLKSNGLYVLELVDGQQRVTSPLDFLNGEFILPKDFIIKDGDMTVDLGGKHCLSLDVQNYMDRIKDYNIKCTWYENLTDEQTSDLFIDVLNNVNSMKPQEIRNAVIGKLSTYTCDTARPVEGDPGHPLFERQIKNYRKANEKEVMKWFSIALNGRMEMDEWLTELIYLKKNGFRHGIKSQTELTNWWKDIQRNGEYKNDLTDKKMLDKLLNFAYDIIKAGKAIQPKKMNSMHTLILVLYADELKNKYGDIHPAEYVNKFFEVYKKWNDIALIQRTDKTQANGSMLPEFSKLFNGKNQNAIQSICTILDHELKEDPDSFGIIERDPKATFNSDDIYKKWLEQDKKDFFDNLPLLSEDAVGDHYIPRSWGIKAGGVTEYSNLVITSSVNNRKKGNMHGDDYLKSCR
jgi:hypothetical protein